MIENLRITVLVENTARTAGLLAEHGLAFWIEADGHVLLFDTGQSHVLTHNARQLDVPLDEVETVVLSHGHFDHTGGLKDLLGRGRPKHVYLHPDAFAARYAKERKPPHRAIGIGDLDEDTLRRLAGRVTWTDRPTELAEGIHVTGTIPRRHELEDVGGPFFLDDACTVPDPIRDDQALYIETAAGLVVVLGCAHSGVINTLDYVAELTGRQQIHAVLGGMHLVRATTDRLEATLDALHRYGVKWVGTAHCTGLRATTYLWHQMPKACFECAVGAVFSTGNGTEKVA